MSEYVMIKMHKEGNKYLVKQDFSSVSLNISPEDMDDILKYQLKRQDIECVKILDNYVLYDAYLRLIPFTGPLYSLDDKGNPVLESELCEGFAIVPLNYDIAKLVFSTCKEQVTKTQNLYFTNIYKETTLDNGMSATIYFNDIYSLYILMDYHEKYIPKEYIKVYERRFSNSSKRRVALFIKNQDAKGEVVKIKVDDCIKKIIIEDNEKKLQDVAKTINASRIEVI